MEDSKICVKHWPEKYETIRKKGNDRPRYPSSVFNVPSFYCRLTSSPRKDKKRKIDAESRREEQLKSDEQNEVIF